MGKSKLRKNHKQKVDSRNQRKRAEQNKLTKLINEQENKLRDLRIQQMNSMSGLKIDPTTKQIMSSKDAIISKLAENHRQGISTSSESLLSDPYKKK